ADVIVSHAHADITCPASPPPSCDATATDFVTGGGWIVSPSDPNAKANFAVAGGMKNGAFWGHLMYLDHGNRLRAKGTAVSGYDVYPAFGSNGRRTTGSADVGGTTESYEADVADDGEPGRAVDKFQLLLNGVPVSSDVLAGGNIQLHKPQCQ
ncbi:MAG TPA: post-COAP-1 domain-containing protein, partial [Myxococcales bacterium]|nr:post-COAP-1 domain-containing protein [Myxococcales bacterium]